MAIRRITFDRFDLGIDHRKGASVSDANRLIEMSNAHVTTGRATEKRPGLKKVATLTPGTKGLYSALGKLNTFYGMGSITHDNALFAANRVTLDGEEAEVTDVRFVDVFNGQIYAAVEFSGVVRHFYNNVPVTDSQCPHTKAVLKAASKMFAVSADGATVRYSKTGDPTNWSAENDAGFLPTGLNSRGDRETNALGMYQNKLVCLARDGAQVWAVDPDPTAMKLEDMVENVGSSFPQTLATVSGDLYFLSDYGFRSITTQQLVARLADIDIGSPIDSLVRTAIRQGGVLPRAVYYYGTGKYMCFMGKKVFVYSVSQTAKIAAWSQYDMPFEIDNVTELEGILYLRSGDEVYVLDEDAYDDDGQAFEVRVQLPYMDFKMPGELKHIIGLDVVLDGECDFSIAWDATNPKAVTVPVRIIGPNTRSHGMIPIGCAGTEFSFILTNKTKGSFRLNAITAYYESMGLV